MNTAKWGPPGWDHLGPAADRYDQLASGLDRAEALRLAVLHKLAFSHTETQLPCKYCRASYSGYIRELPPDGAIMRSISGSPDNLNNWLYQIHNKVNDKLRKQGYNTKPDPSPSQALRTIRTKSRDLIKVTGWDYLHSIAHNYPDAPEVSHVVNAKLFFSTLPYMLPHPELTGATLEFCTKYPVDNNLESRTSLVIWLFVLHSYLNDVYQNLGQRGQRLDFREMCTKYEGFRAKCGKSKGMKGPSCRLPISKTMESQNLNELLKALE